MSGNDDLIALRPHPFTRDDSSVMYRAGQIRLLFSAIAERDATIERLTAEVQSEVDAAIRQISTLTRLRYDAEALAAKAIRERDEALKRNVELQVLAHGWMVAHDMLKAGKPYQFPRPADLPDAIRERDEARAECERKDAALKRVAEKHHRSAELAKEALAPRQDASWFAEDVRRASERQAKLEAELPSSRAALHPEGAKDG